VDVPCPHCCLLFASILIVMHMFVAASDPLSNVFGGVAHDFLNGATVTGSTTEKTYKVSAIQHKCTV